MKASLDYRSMWNIIDIKGEVSIQVGITGAAFLFVDPVVEGSLGNVPLGACC